MALAGRLKGKKVGLALGGGAVLGAAHIGVLKALEEKGIRADYVSGTSVGSYIGALYAFGMPWNKIDAIARDLKWLDVSRISISQYGLLSNSKLGDLIEENLGDVTFEQSPVPFAVVATDISNGEEVVLRKGSVAQAVMASTCIPGVVVPVEIEGRLLVDGGVVENVPIAPLKRMGADLIIAVDLNSGRRVEKPQNIIDVLLRSFHFLRKSATRLQTGEADILILPDLTDFNMYDMDQAGDLFDAGYNEAVKMLKGF
jgi:NTE family protein